MSVSVSTSSKTSKSLVQSVRSLSEVMRFMRSRQEQLGIPDTLVKEILSDSVVTDRNESQALHVSDHVILITEDQGGDHPVVITKYRHPLCGEWRADSTKLHHSGVENLDTVYFFYQVSALLHSLLRYVPVGNRDDNRKGISAFMAELRTR